MSKGTTYNKGGGRAAGKGWYKDVTLERKTKKVKHQAEERITLKKLYYSKGNKKGWEEEVEEN